MNSYPHEVNLIYLGFNVYIPLLALVPDWLT